MPVSEPQPPLVLRLGLGAGRGDDAASTLGSEPHPARIAYFVMPAVGMGIQILSHLGGRAYSDLEFLYTARPMGGGVLPYLHTSLEYPSGTGILLWALRTVAGGLPSFALAYAFAAIATWIAIGRMLGSLGGHLALRRWACSPLIALYLFHNFDVFVIASGVAALWSYRRERYTSCGLWLGLAVAIKLFPAFWLLPIAVGTFRRCRARPTRAVARLVIGFMTALLVTNVPFLIVSWRGWAYPFQFQTARPANWESVWRYIGEIAPFVSPRMESALVILIVGAVSVVAGYRSDGSFVAVVGACFVCTVAFMAANRVYSPQYTLWVLPMLALLPVPRRNVQALVTVEIAIYLVIFFRPLRHILSPDLVEVVVPVFCAARLAALVACWWSVRGISGEQLRPSRRVVPTLSGGVLPMVSPPTVSDRSS